MFRVARLWSDPNLGAEGGAWPSIRSGRDGRLPIILLAAAIVIGGPGAAKAVTVGLTYLEVDVRSAKTFPDDLHDSDPDRPAYAIAGCGPCGRTHFALFDATLGDLKSVTVGYEGGFDSGGGEFDYDDMGLTLYMSGYRIGDLLSDRAGFDFSGRYVVPDESVSNFIARDGGSGAAFGNVDFEGYSFVYFDSIGDGYKGSMGGFFDVTVRYGYEPDIAPVPLPPAALLAFGSLGALFAASRRRRSAPRGVRP